MGEAQCSVCGTRYTREGSSPPPAESASVTGVVLICPACREKLDQPRAEIHGTTVMRPKAAPRDASKGPTSLRFAGADGAIGADGAGEPGAAAPESAPPETPATGKVFGNYEILEEISRGSFGVVYRAQQRGLDRVVALKVLLAGTHASPEAVARFQREARAVARLKHPNIVPVYDIGTQDGHHYFAMEFVEGLSLSAKIARKELGIPEALAIVEALADAIETAHGEGVIHRDIKPSNILVDRKGDPHITDFGLAKQVNLDTQYTQSGTTLGTPAYMPPEQARGEVGAINACSDVYALGAVLYEMLTGHPPFAGRSLLEVVIAVINEPVRPPRQVNPKIHRDIQTIVMKCLEKDSRNRYASAAELRDDLRRFRSGEAIRARPVGTLRMTGRFLQRHSFLLLSLTVVLLAVSIAVSRIQEANDRERQTKELQEQREQEAREREEEERKARNPEWKPFWWWPEGLVDEKIPQDDRQLFKGERAFLPSRYPAWDLVNGQTQPVQYYHVSPDEKRIFGDLRAVLDFSLTQEAAAADLRVGIQSYEKGIPYVLWLRPGRLALIGPLPLYRAGDDRRPMRLDLVAEKRIPPLSEGAYRLKVERNGLSLDFSLVRLAAPHAQAEETAGPPLAELHYRDASLSNWIFKNIQLTVREIHPGCQVLAVRMDKKNPPRILDDLSQALGYFQNGEYNKAEADFQAIADKAVQSPQDRYKRAQAHYYLGLIRDICQSVLAGGKTHYLDAVAVLKTLEGEKEEPLASDVRRLHAQALLGHLIRAIKLEQTAESAEKIAAVKELADAIRVWPPHGAGVGEPCAWDLQPLMIAALEKGSEQAFDTAFQLFRLMGLPPGGERLDLQAGIMAVRLAGLGRMDDLLELHQAYPTDSPNVRFAFWQTAVGAAKPSQALKAIAYAARVWPDDPDLPKASGRLMARCVHEDNLEGAREAIALLPRPLLVSLLSEAWKERVKGWKDEELQPLPVMAEALQAQRYDLAARLYVEMRGRAPAVARRLYPLVLTALESLAPPDRDTALKELQESEARRLRKDPAGERTWRLEWGDLLLALGLPDRAEAAYQELFTEPGAEAEVRARAGIRLGALFALRRNHAPADLWGELAGAEYPEEVRLAARFLKDGLLKPEELDAELQRAGGPGFFSAAEWDILRAIRLRAGEDSKLATVAVQAAAKKCEAERAWPNALAKIIESQPPDAPKQPSE